jgi:hypothetical protein
MSKMDYNEIKYARKRPRGIWLKGLNLILFGTLLTLFLGVYAHTEQVSAQNTTDNNLTADLLNITILSPSSNQIVPKVVTVEGAVEPGTLKGENLWILVGPMKNPDDWWPQAGGPLRVIDGRFSGPAFLGGSKGDDFKIAVLVANGSINEKIIQWRENCNASNYWPPITKEDPVTKVMIPKETIDNQIAKTVLVKLGE